MLGTTLRGGGGKLASETERTWPGALRLPLLIRVGRVGDRTGRVRVALAAIDAALGVMPLLIVVVVRPVTALRVSVGGREGRTGVGLVDLLLTEGAADAVAGETARRTEESGVVAVAGPFARGLGSKASLIRLAVLMARETVDDGGTGVTGSFGSGNVLERLRGKERGGGGVLDGKALGGEVGRRLGGERDRLAWDSDIFNSGLVRVIVSGVGEGVTRGLDGAVGVFSVGVIEAGERGVAGSILAFETVRAWDKGADRVDGADVDTEGRVRALLAAVGWVTLLLAKGMIGRLRIGVVEFGPIFEDTTGVTVRLAGALFGGTGGGRSSDGVPAVGGADLAIPSEEEAEGAEADGLCLDEEEKRENGYDLLVVVLVAVEEAEGFVGERRAGRRERAS